MKISANVVWRLLRRNISPWQIIGYAAANLIGLTIVLTAVQFYRDFDAGQGSGDDDDSLLTSDFMIISKKVSLLNTLGAGKTSFDADDLDELRSQPWTRRVGEFRSADFNVYASLRLGGRGMSTYLFFESIPDEFFDIKPSGWDFDPADPVIPIVLSKDYLTLYNFGFAATRGLPQLSEDVITKVPLKMRLSGKGNTGTYDARIVGFSSRLNTIAVPEAVMQWADSLYSEPLEKTDGPSRVILEVTKPGDPAITDFLDSRGYEVAGDKAGSSRAAFIFNLVTVIVIAIGSVITLLAFFILTLSLYLLLQKNRAKLHDLMLLGYTPTAVARYYYMLVAAVNSCVFVAASILTAIAAHLWQSSMGTLQVPPAPFWPTAFVGFAIMLVITHLNIVSVRRIVRRAF